MIENNKYYLQYSDGIYSFKDKILYSYDELSNIHFSYKINRTFHKFNKKIMMIEWIELLFHLSGFILLEFYAKCLIYNEVGNPESAKVLNWVVDKKMLEL